MGPVKKRMLPLLAKKRPEGKKKPTVLKPDHRIWDSPVKKPGKR